MMNSAVGVLFLFLFMNLFAAYTPIPKPTNQSAIFVWNTQRNSFDAWHLTLNERYIQDDAYYEMPRLKEQPRLPGRLRDVLLCNNLSLDNIKPHWLMEKYIAAFEQKYKRQPQTNPVAIATSKSLLEDMVLIEDVDMLSNLVLSLKKCIQWG